MIIRLKCKIKIQTRFGSVFIQIDFDITQEGQITSND